MFSIPNETLTVSGNEVILKDCYFYLLYKRKGDETTQIPILMDKEYDSGTDTISASFEPTSYFTELNGGMDIQVFACSTEQDFVDEDVDIEDVALWTTFNAQISIAKSQLKNSQTIVAEDMFTKGIAEMSAYLDSAESEADDAGEYASDAEEFAKGTRSDGLTVPHASTGAHDNAKDYKDLAKDWASKIGGAVESREYSAKYYAVVSDTRSQEAEAYALGTKGGTPVPTFADKNAKDWATKTGSTVDGTNYSSKQYALNAKASADIVEEHATAIDAIYADLTNIDAVATDIQDEDSIINTVADNIQDVNSVAESITDVNTVAGKTTQITTVAGIASDVTTVAGIASDVTAVAGIASDVSAVEDIKTDVSAVASIDTDVSAVSAIKDDVSAVATIDDDVTTVATDITDVSTVASDITKVTAVADDLTNIDAVADDLTNIDNAEANALKAEGWANGTQNGTPVSSDSPYYENNAKYWADAVPDLKDAIEGNSQRIENLEVAVSGSLVQTNILTDPPSMANVRTIANANEILPWALLNRVGARDVAWNQLIYNGNFSASNPLDGWESSGSNLSASGGVLTVTPHSANGQAYRTFNFLSNHTYLLIADMKLSSANNTTRALLASPGLTLSEYCASNTSWQTITRILASPTAGTGYVIFRDDSSNSPFDVRNVNFFDLTAMNEASLTADQFKAKYPSSYYPHNTGEIINLNPSGFVVQGVNLWDEQWESGDISSSTGENVPSSSYIRGVNYYPCLPSTEYYGKAENKIYLLWYDKQKNYIGYTANGFQNTYRASPEKAYYFRISINTISYGNNVQVCLNSYADKTTYHKSNYATLDTSFTSDYKYVNPSCYDYSENVLVDGVMRRKEHRIVGSYTFTGNEAWSEGGTNTTGIVRMAFTALQGIIKGVDNDAVANITNGAGYSAVTNNQTYSKERGISVATNGNIYIYDENYNTSGSSTSFASYMAGKTIYFELATPTTSLHNDPIPNIPCDDGTTVTAITPQTDLVNAVDVPSTIAYMTKIGG